MVRLQNSISVSAVWLSLTVYCLLPHTFVCLLAIAPPPPCFVPLAHLHLSCSPKRGFRRSLGRARRRNRLPASSSPALRRAIHTCTPALPASCSFLFRAPSPTSVPPQLRAEYSLQSQGLRVSTSLTLREPCLRLSTRVHVSVCVCASLEHLLCECVQVCNFSALSAYACV